MLTARLLLLIGKSALHGNIHAARRGIATIEG
jgi:hypothetical protein